MSLADWWSNSKLYVYVDPEVLKTRIGKEHSLLLMNHTYEIDWLFGWIFCEKMGVLGNCKAYAKKVIQYIPAIGWAWKFAEFVFLERSFDKDKIIIDRQVNEIFDYPDPCWVSMNLKIICCHFCNCMFFFVQLLLNAEGTRFTPEKHEACNVFCRERGIPELKHHLIPRAKGFQASLQALKAKCPSILDIQIVFKKDSPVRHIIHYVTTFVLNSFNNLVRTNGRKSIAWSTNHRLHACSFDRHALGT